MTLKNTFIHIFLGIWKKIFSSYSVDPHYPRYLVVSTTGLGDTLWATPALKTLRASQPHAYIALLTTPSGYSILETNPYLDHIFIMRPSLFSKIKLVYALRKAHLPTTLLFHTSQRSVLPLCVMGGSSQIIATQGQCKGLDALITTLLPSAPCHEIERRIQIVKEIQTLPLKIHSHLDFFLTPDDVTECKTFLESLRIPPYIPLVGIHPGAKDSFKCWPPHLFAVLGKRLKEELGCQILVTGCPEEKALVTSIVSTIPGAIACCDLPIRPLGALIQSLKLFITNDTGPMHIAFALSTPTVAIFSPTDARLCGPYLAPNVALIKKSPTCQPCLRKRCQEPFCMLQISPEEVFKTACRLFYKQGGSY